MRNGVVRGKSLWFILTVVLAALLLITACAPAAPEREGKVVEVGYLLGLTGPSGAASQIALATATDYFKYINEETDTIPGVNLNIRWVDVGYDAPRAVSAYQRLVDGGTPLIMVMQPGDSEAIKPKCEKDGVPVIAQSLTENIIYPPGFMYSTFPTESEKFAVVCDWIVENWQEERPPRVAFMGADSPYGRAAEVMGKKYAEGIGIEMLPMEIVPYMPIDTSPQLLRLVEQGVDFAYICSANLATVPPLLRDAERLALTGKIRFGGYENSQSESLIESLGPSADGFFAPRAYPWYEEVPFLLELKIKYHGKLELQGDEASVPVWGAMVAEVIKRAIDNVGYENLDGGSIKKALDSIKDFDAHGIGKPITYRPEDHRGSATVRIYEIQGDDVVPVSDWREAPMLMPEE